MVQSLPNQNFKKTTGLWLWLGFLLCTVNLFGQSQTFNSSGTFVVPAGVTSITVQAWGGGGGAGNQNDRCGGGGGGAYARKVIAVSPGQMYAVVVGSGGNLESNGGNSSFGANLVVAEGGKGGNDEDGGNGGSASNSIGDVKFSGGNGGDGRNNGGGGGGGGSAFNNANGQDGSDGGNTSGGSGGSGTGDGGRGGDEDGSPAAQAGNAPGGGGGGRGDDSGSSQAGAAGQVVVSWCVSGPATLPYTEDFESAGPALEFTSDEAAINGLCNWAFDEVESSGRLRFDEITAHSATKAALMDRTSTGSDQTNYLILTLDLSNYSCSNDLQLSFWHAQYDDEDDGNDRVWIRGNDGAAWIQIHDLTSSQGSDGTWVQVSGLDIDQALANNGQSVSATFQVRFGQEDNASYSLDGRAFDDISITGTGGNCCTDPVITYVQATADTICKGDETMLSVIGTLNNATEWHWYTGSCGGTPVGTGMSITVSPTTLTTYYVRGEGGCVTPGNCAAHAITIHPSLTVYDLGGGGAYCEGGAGSPVTLSGSQPGVTYQLKLDGSNVTSLPGTGGALNFGNQTGPGIYTIVATNNFTSCTAEMNGSVEVSTKPTPTCSISEPMSAVCPNSIGNHYDAPAGMDTYSWSISGNGSIPGAKNGQSVSVTAGASGSYTLTVTIAKDGCTSSCTKMVNIATTPYVITYSDEYCNQDPGPMIGLSGSENGAMYQLQTGGGVNLGAPVAGNGSPINFGAYPVGNYKVVITGGTCNETIMANVTSTPVGCAVQVPNYCTCNGPDGYAPITIKINAPEGQVWTVKDVIGLYGPQNPFPQIAPGAVLNYVGGNMHTLDAARSNTKGFWVQVTNGYTDLDIMVGTPAW